MKGLPIVAALAVACTVGSTARAADEVDVEVAKSREVVQAFAKNLKAELQQAMEAGGPTEAIGVCQAAASGIAAQQSKDSGWDVGRTALRLRNLTNMPDAWERAVMEEFESRKAAGEDIQMMEHHETVSGSDATTYRYMKAIPTVELCTTCHGANLAPEVKAKLTELYPDDRATGFAAGDIRGAFTLKKRLD